MPILENLHAELKDGTLYLSATDLETYVTRVVEIGGGIDGEACFNPARLYNLLKTGGTSRVEITVDEDFRLNIESNNGTFNEKGDDPEDFPDRLGLRQLRKKGRFGGDGEGEPEMDWVLSADSSVISNMLGGATPFVLPNDDGGKDTLKYVHVETEDNTLTVRASNGTEIYRARREIAGQPKEVSTLLPTSLANHAGDFATNDEVNFYLQDTRGLFFSDSKIVTGKLSHRTPLNIDKAIRDDDGMFCFSMESDDLRSALVRAGCYTRKDGICRFTIDADRVQLQSSEAAVGSEMEETLPVEVERPRVYGPPRIEAVFKIQTLRKCLSPFKKEKVTFEFYGVGRPAFLRKGDDVLVGAMTIAE